MPPYTPRKLRMGSQDHQVAVMQMQWLHIHSKQSWEFFFSYVKIVWNCTLERTHHLPTPSPWRLSTIQKGWAPPKLLSMEGGSEMLPSCSNQMQRREGGARCCLLYLLRLGMVSLTTLLELIVFLYLHLPCRHNALNCVEWLAYLWLAYLWFAYFSRNMDSRSMQPNDNTHYQKDVIGSLGHSYHL